MYYTVYRIVNKINGKTYIGKHQTKNLDDGYMGSGKILKRAIQKYGIQNFQKEILYIFDNQHDMNKKEEEMVVISEETYNIRSGGSGGFDFINSNKLNNSEKQRATARILGPKLLSTMDRNKYKEDFRRGGLNSWAKGHLKAYSWLGRKHKEESKKKIGEANRVKSSGKGNSQYGTIWITNGTKNQKIKPHDLDIWITRGYRKGRKMERLMLKRFYLNCNDGISPERVSQIVEEHGKDVLIGIDPGERDRPNEDSMATIEAVKEHGARLHVYLVGPGMWSWSEGEREQIKFLAESVGIDTSENGWKTEWYKSGWEKKVFEQFKYYHDKFNAYSCEIDNLDSSVLKDDFEKYVEFYKRFSVKLKKAGVKTKLMLKNIDEDGLNLIKDAIDSGDLDREFLADWGMFEEGSGDPSAQIRICKEMGIYAATPESGITDTNHYGVDDDGVPRA